MLKRFMFTGIMILSGFLLSDAAIEYGIAQKYPGDANIQSDTNVILFESFENTTVTNLSSPTRWNTVRGTANMSFPSDVPPAASGTSSLSMSGVSGGYADLFRQFGKDYQELYFRFYVKYNATTCQDLHHGVWLGGYRKHETGYWGYAGWALPPLEAFSAGMEPLDFSRWDIYSYSANMQTANDGKCWGNLYGSGLTTLGTHRGQWECIETMIKMNNPVDSSNGEVAGWINGVKVLHLGKGFPMGRWENGGVWTNMCRLCIPFPGFQWRVHNDFALNWAFLEHYVDRDPDCQALYDNVVVSKKYVGPIPGSVGMENTELFVPGIQTRPFSVKTRGSKNLQFDFQTGQNGPGFLELYDVAGNRLWRHVWDHAVSGSIRATWETSMQLPQGILLAKLFQDGKISAHRMIVP